ncbi:MAG: hypothetical protein LBQ15_00415 [Clostridium sp.]|jgi:hypothetical protein|nr:hypothetical protein [Clostridium sp.]
MKNEERMIVQIIQEICLEESMDYAAFSYGWILRLQKGDRVGFVYGYQFGVNHAASARICDDKSAASDILLHSSVPAVEHFFFMAPGNLHYVGGNGNWERIGALFRQYGSLVCKANEGTGGNAVFWVQDEIALEKAVHKIFRRHGNMAVSPYYGITKEYRVIVLGGCVKLAYAKNIPYVVGDGRRNLRQLLLEYMSEAQVLIRFDSDDEKLEQILPKGGIRAVSWKSNLGQGASPEIIAGGRLYHELCDLALLAANALSIDFASIDIVDTACGLKVLEVNCGIMMEHFIRSASEYYEIAKEIYREAVFAMLRGRNI